MTPRPDRRPRGGPKSASGGRSAASSGRAGHGRAERGVGGEQVEGRRAVGELLRAGRRRVREVWLSETADASAASEIEAQAGPRNVAVRTVARARLDAAAATSAPQGVIAWADSLPEADLEQLVRADDGPPFLVVLDGVTDPQNLGTILRTALSAGATGVVLPRHRSALVTPAVAKAAAGAIEYLPIAVVPGVPSAIKDLAAGNVWTVGLDAAGADPVFGLRVATEPLALVLGAEGKGLARLTKERCDLLVHIPMAGPLGSLNVAAAAAIACFEVAQRRNR